MWFTRCANWTSIAQIKAEIAELKADLLRYIVTISLGTGALVVALIKLIPGGHLRPEICWPGGQANA